MTLPVASLYWIGQPVGQTAPIIYSAPAGAVVSTSDEAYVAALTAGNVALPWPNDAAGATTTAALDAILAFYGLPTTGLTPPSGAQLLAYANGKVNAALAVSRPYDLAAAGGGGAATVRSDCSTATGANLLALNVWAASNPMATQPWVDDFGVVTVLTGAQFQELGLSVQTYGASVWGVLAAAAQAIASGTITMTSAIDALAWPA